MNTYFKSFVTIEHNPVTTTYNPHNDSRKICQTLGEILESGVIKPNTVHSQLEKRLCTSLIVPGYEGVYRPEGLIFETAQDPDYVLPFDMMALTSSKTFTSADYHKIFLEGSRQFQYNTLSEMLEQFPSSSSAIEALNQFRREYDLSPIDKKAMGYNECCFNNNVNIKPAALIGQSQVYQELAIKYGVLLYSSMDEYQKIKKTSLSDFTRKSIMGALFRVGSSFTIDGLAYLALTGGESGQFFERFQADKFLSVTAAVVAINFVDYKWDITNKLDKLTEKGIRKITSLFD